MNPQKSHEENFEKGKEAFAKGDFANAVDYFSRINPDVLAADDRPNALLLHGLSLYETGARRDALKKIKDALALNPHFAAALDAWGNILSDEGKFYAAIARYRSATKADPALWLPYFHWGYLLKKMGSPKAALRKFTAALARNPEELDLYIHAGDCSFQLSRFDEALSFYLAAKEKGGASTDILSRIGNVYLLLGNNEEAVNAYKTSIELNPQEGSGYENWGLLLQKEGKLDEAAAKYEEGLRAVPDFPTLLLRHGELLVTVGKPREAIPPLEKALGIFLGKVEGEWGVQWASILAECAYTLGFAYKQIGLKDKGKECFMTALHYSPNHLNALQELAILRGIYREHHLAWEFVVEGEVDGNHRGAMKGLRAYRVAAIDLNEAIGYASECERDIKGTLRPKDVTHTGQVATYAGVLARGPLVLLQYRDEAK